MTRKMEISEEEDRKWHEKHDKPEELSKHQGRRSVKPFAELLRENSSLGLNFASLTILIYIINDESSGGN